MKIGFVSLDHLRDWTGITRLIDRLASEMTARGHEVTVIALDNRDRRSSKIPVSALAYPHKLIALDLSGPAGRGEAKEKIKASGLDICAASVGTTLVMYMPLLFSGSGIPYILGEPADPRVYTFERWQPYEHYGTLFSADAFTTLLPQYLPYYPEALRERAAVIGNPAPEPADIDLSARRAKTTRTIISAGRFNEEDKRFSFLLRAFAMLSGEFPDWRLKLAGDGPYREFYDIMAEQLGIKKLTDFTGALDDVGPHYESADIFCLPSFEAEGFPMVFPEAAAYALPLVGYSSCAASRALIGPGMGALAAGDDGKNTPEALAGALRELMELSPEEREAAGQNARETFRANYGGSVIFDMWERLFVKTLEETRVSGKTASERIFSNMTDKDISRNWSGLGPDDPVWTKELLTAAAAEILKREDPLKAPEESGADLKTENVRLRSEIARLRLDCGALEKKYGSLLGQFQALAGKRGKR
ncbi:MAG: glycosyltransferase [Oscillospiraceae bacterium]|nr:glycosyltransferase [Oscillospiraceae bacterium]